MIVEVDVEGGKMVVSLMDGMLPASDAFAFLDTFSGASLTLTCRDWSGDIAQQGERGVRIAEVGGSSPPISTNTLDPRRNRESGPPIGGQVGGFRLRRACPASPPISTNIPSHS